MRIRNTYLSITMFTFRLENLKSTNLDEKGKCLVDIVIDTIQDEVKFNEFEILCATLDVRCLASNDLRNCYKDINMTPDELLQKHLKSNGISEFGQNLESSSKSNSRESVDLFEDDSDDSEIDVTKDEIKRYLKVVEKPDRILTWWRDNEKQYKNLAILAKKCFTVSVVSFPRDFFSMDWASKLLKLNSIGTNQSDVAFLHFNEYSEK